MSSATPLMSEYPVEKKANDAYQVVDESDVELVVGQPQRKGCFWSRFRRGGACCRRSEDGSAPKRSRARKAVRVVLAFLFITGIVAFFWGKHHVKQHIKEHPITCIPVTETTTSVELPLSHFARLGLHPSLTTGDSKITHSESVKPGSVVIEFELPEDTKFVDDKDEPKLFACSMVGPKMTALGVHAKHGEKHSGEMHHDKHHDKKPEHDERHGRKFDGKERPHTKRPHGPRVKASSVTIKLPASEAGRPRSISFWGGRFPYGMRKFGSGCMRMRIKKAIAAAAQHARLLKAAATKAE